MPEHALARSFEIIGDDYDRYRPGFPEAAAAMIVPTTVDVGLDLGAGTGKFTELLVDRARRTVAVEPSERMLQVLRVKLPDVEAQIGAAERIPLGDASVDVVTVAQAFHWFDRDAACDEIARVLVPEGRSGCSGIAPIRRAPGTGLVTASLIRRCPRPTRRPTVRLRSFPISNSSAGRRSIGPSVSRANTIFVDGRR